MHLSIDDFNEMVIVYFSLPREKRLLHPLNLQIQRIRFFQVTKDEWNVVRSSPSVFWWWDIASDLKLYSGVEVR